MASRDSDFQFCRSEGGLLPPDLLRRVISQDKALAITPKSYSLPEGERLNDAIAESWSRMRKYWLGFEAAAKGLGPEETGTGLTNEKWSLPLLKELGYGPLPASAALKSDDDSTAIARAAGPVPIHLVGCGLSLDKRVPGQKGAAKASPHGVLQDFLNRSGEHLWGIVSNGLKLRILRDSQKLSRQAYVEFDLEGMFRNEGYSDFVLLYLLAHATRLIPADGAKSDACIAEVWAKQSEAAGTRALESLRAGVEHALEKLGKGLCEHPDNRALREALREGRLSLTEYHTQLLRVVYRIIFLCVAEDRTLDGRSLLHPIEDTDLARQARERYARHYSLGRLRRLAGSIKGSRHGDLWQQFQAVVGALAGSPESAAIREALALPALGSFLWASESTSALNGLQLSNNDLLDAIRDLAFTRQERALRPVDYRNLGTEELGSVYEGLLALTPQISDGGKKFSYKEFAGNQRKTSGSYYTPDSLVQCLLDSALDPVVAQAIEGKVGAEAEQALLDLKVCDPAVGSGHFLVGAAHRLARHLSRVRAFAQGEAEPSPLSYQKALRDVIGRCLYGVDLNPMSAELCRVGLWLEALEPGKPLSFLDHHIRVGNSLIGATSELIAKGIPDEAFDPVEGDDKAIAQRYKKQNRNERKAGSVSLFSDLSATLDAGTHKLAEAAVNLQGMADDSLESIERKRGAFDAMQAGAEYQRALLAASTWCATFFWPLTEGQPEPLTEGQFQAMVADGKALPPRAHDLVHQLARANAFFHWHLAFPEVAERGGFDCILGNPPWERVKLQEKEWFAERVPAIAAAPNAAARGRMIEDLKKSAPHIRDAFLADVRRAEASSAFLRSSGRYPLCGRGDVNLYTVFVESMRSSVSPRGRTGCIVPSGIATDDTTKHFFQDLVARASLVSLYDFENKLLLFPDVAPPMKFCLLTLRAPAVRDDTTAAVKSPEFVFFAQKVEDLGDDWRRFTLTREEIALVNPNTRTCPIFRSRTDAELTKYIYRRVPVLVDESKPGAEGNPWGVEFARLFDMANDSGKFLVRESLEQDGWRLEGNVFHKGDKKCSPLYEAKMFHQYDHRYNTYDGVPVSARFNVKAHALPLGELAVRPDCVALPRYWIAWHEVAARLANARYMVAFRDVTNVSTNRRTGIFSVLPGVAANNKAPVISSFSGRVGALLGFVGMVNSFPFDYCLRQSVGGSSLSLYILRQIPALPVSVLANFQQRRGGEKCRFEFAFEARVLELSATSDDMQSLVHESWPAGSGGIFKYDAARRDEIRCELDAAFFHLYLGSPSEWSASASPELLEALPSPRDAVAYIMDTFPIVRRKDEEAHGSYRTKERILEIYDQLTRCIAEGREFKSSLNPPPGPPTNPDGSFAALPPWPKGAPRPAEWPEHIHPPASHRE